MLLVLDEGRLVGVRHVDADAVMQLPGKAVADTGQPDPQRGAVERPALVAGLGRPVTAPSANPPGRTPPRRIDEARACFGDGVAVYLDGGELPGGASTVAAVEEGRVRVLRAGPVSGEALVRALEGG